MTARRPVTVTTRPADFVAAWQREKATPATARKSWVALWKPKAKGDSAMIVFKGIEANEIENDGETRYVDMRLCSSTPALTKSQIERIAEIVAEPRDAKLRTCGFCGSDFVSSEDQDDD